MDRDGLVDVALSASAGSLDETAFVQIHSGADLRVLHRFERGPETCAAWGAVAAAGDLDADGCDDVVVGTDGGCWVEDGRPALVARMYSGAGGNLLHSLSGEFDMFANSVSGAGDVDGDGHDDVLVASRSILNRVTLVSGATGAELRVWANDADEAGFGHAVCSVGDVDRDGVDDVAVGIANWNTPSIPGRVRVFSARTGALLYSLDSSSLAPMVQASGR